jgi:hypothetical protein
MKKSFLAFLLVAALGGAHVDAQTGQPVWLTRPVTINSGSITLTGPVTAVISGQPITVLQSGSVTVVQGGPVTLGAPVTLGSPVTLGAPATLGAPVTLGSPVTLGAPATVQFVATPTNNAIITDGTNFAGVTNVNTAISSAGTTAGLIALDTVHFVQNNFWQEWTGVATTNQTPGAPNVIPMSGNIGFIRNGLGSFTQMGQVDAVSNTQTALGVAAVADPSFAQTAVTFTSTGAVTNGPFIPFAQKHEWSVITTGTITAAAVSWYGSNDGVNFDTARPATQVTLTSFSGTDHFSFVGAPAAFVRTLVTITTLGGTNIILKNQDGP